MQFFAGGWRSQCDFNRIELMTKNFYAVMGAVGNGIQTLLAETEHTIQSIFYFVPQEPTRRGRKGAKTYPLQKYTPRKWVQQSWRRWSRWPPEQRRTASCCWWRRWSRWSKKTELRTHLAYLGVSEIGQQNLRNARSTFPDKTNIEIHISK